MEKIRWGCCIVVISTGILSPTEYFSPETRTLSEITYENLLQRHETFQVILKSNSLCARRCTCRLLWSIVDVQCECPDLKRSEMMPMTKQHSLPHRRGIFQCAANSRVLHMYKLCTAARIQVRFVEKNIYEH